MNIATIVEAVGIRSKPSGCGGTVFEENHFWLLFLQDKHTQWCGLCIGRPPLPCRCRIHAAYQPFPLFLSFQSRDILVMAVYKDSFIKNDSIGNEFHIFGRCIPFSSYIYRCDFRKLSFCTQMARQQPIQSITYRSERIIELI